MRKTGRGRYALFVRELAPRLPLPEGDEILERFARMLEEDICRMPGYWLWSHKRWKYRVELPSSPAPGES
jgi:KDO2-lipid IV(A) lauroyltransferase